MTSFYNGIIVVCILLCGVSISQAQIANTPHNLSATGPGAFKATGTTDICVFCHTPHNAAPSRALWNRDLPPTTYKLYQSSTLEAQVKQPTGASRLCLSCHDGTTALGALRVKPDGAGVALGPLTGKASLGTDLSDDHPVSFVYDSALASRQGQLVDPMALPSQIRIDETRQLQCTACHEPHSSSNRRFLRMDDRYAALCTACHNLRDWSRSAHANSRATGTGMGTKPWADKPYASVAENGCENCHQTHAAPHPQRLLANAQETKVCLTCHNGSVAVKYLEGEFLKFSAHPIFATNWIHDAKEGSNTMVRHVTCTDCHNPHQASDTPAAPPLVPGPLDGVSGITISGGTISKANYEYEVCLKCHGTRDQTTSGIVRQDNVRNIRLKISLGNPSFHPVAATGKNSTMGGFEAGYSTASIISCTDCHNNDAWTPGGTQPRGSHGSQYSPILAANYQANDPSTESFQSYALCYKCHNRNFLINDQGGTFPHKVHVVDKQSSCAACHDAHGSRRHIGLINFMLRDRTGKTVVSPATDGTIQFKCAGTRRRRQCFLTCHEKSHNAATFYVDLSCP